MSWTLKCCEEKSRILQFVHYSLESHCSGRKDNLVVVCEANSCCRGATFLILNHLGGNKCLFMKSSHWLQSYNLSCKSSLTFFHFRLHKLFLVLLSAVSTTSVSNRPSSSTVWSQTSSQLAWWSWNFLFFSRVRRTVSHLCSFGT